MSISTRSYARPYGSRGGLPRGIQALLLINKQGGTAITTGLMDKFAIEQGVREIKHVEAK